MADVLDPNDDSLQQALANWNAQRNQANQLRIPVPQIPGTGLPPVMMTPAPAPAQMKASTPSPVANAAQQFSKPSSQPSPAPIALPNAGQSMPGLPPVTTSPSAQADEKRVEAAQQKLDDIQSKPAGVIQLQQKADQVQNPVLRPIAKVGAGALRGLETLGDILLPGPMQGIPGTQLNRNMRVNAAQQSLDNAEKDQLEGAQAENQTAEAELNKAKVSGAAAEPQMLKAATEPGYEPITNQFGQVVGRRFIGKEEVIADPRQNIPDPQDPTKQIANPLFGKSIPAMRDPNDPSKFIIGGQSFAASLATADKPRETVSDDDVKRGKAAIDTFFPNLSPEQRAQFYPTKDMTTDDMYKSLTQLSALSKIPDQQKEAALNALKLKADIQKTQADIANETYNPGADAFGNPLNPDRLDRKTFETNKRKFTSDYINPLRKTEQSYAQFNDILDDINAGHDISGAQSVVALFNAIGISASPLKGMGMRINNNTVQEHENARGLDQRVYQWFLGLKNGDIITPQQIRDYANIEVNTRQQQYYQAIDEARREGVPVDFLPQGHGKTVDSNVAKLFAYATPNQDLNKTIAPLEAAGWKIPPLRK